MQTLEDEKEELESEVSAKKETDRQTDRQTHKESFYCSYTLFALVSLRGTILQQGAMLSLRMPRRVRD